LSVLEINAVAINLSSFEFFEAVAALLTATARANSVIPEDLALRLAQWLRRYDGHPDQARIEDHLNRRLPSARRTTVGFRRPV
jgi:hypothetical protein